MASDSRPRALITGVAGQDGSYLAKHLSDLGYEVHGTVRQQPDRSFPTLADVDGLTLHWADLLDGRSLDRVVAETSPDEVYNLAAAAFVPTSLAQPELVGEVTGIGAARLFEAVRRHRPEAKVFQASSSEMFAGSAREPITPDTALRPRNPYGAAKAYAHLMAVQYREVQGLPFWTGISFNHESPRRREGYVSRKITQAAVEISLGKRDRLVLGNLDARRDWGYAPEYVEVMHRLLQEAPAGDYVIATGESHSVRHFAELAFARVGLDAGEYVESDPALFRKGDMDLLADPSRTFEVLDWRPATNLAGLVDIIVDADRKEAARSLEVVHSGRGEEVGGASPVEYRDRQ